jgi:hypothetical protein
VEAKEQAVAAPAGRTQQAPAEKSTARCIWSLLASPDLAAQVPLSSNSLKNAPNLV